MGEGNVEFQPEGQPSVRCPCQPRGRTDIMYPQYRLQPGRNESAPVPVRVFPESERAVPRRLWLDAINYGKNKGFRKCSNC